MQESQAVQYDEDGNASVGGNRGPERGETCECEHDEKDFNRQGRENILADYGQCSTRVTNQPGDLRQVVAHQGDVGRFDGCIAAHRAHSDS